MAERTLSSEMQEAGGKLLQITDDLGLEAQGAAWIYSTEDQSWNYFLATALYDDLGPTWIYRKLLTAFKTVEIPRGIAKAEIHLASTSHGLFQLMSRITRVTGNSRVSFTNNVVDGFLLPEAFIYRILPSSPAYQVKANARRFEKRVGALVD